MQENTTRALGQSSEEILNECMVISALQSTALALESGLRTDQISAVRGFADTELRVPSDSLDPRNRRVSIVVRSPSAREFERSLRERQTSTESITAAAAGSDALPVPDRP